MEPHMPLTHLVSYLATRPLSACRVEMFIWPVVLSSSYFTHLCLAPTSVVALLPGTSTTPRKRPGATSLQRRRGDTHRTQVSNMVPACGTNGEHQVLVLLME